MGPPYPHPSRPTRLSCSSTATHSNSSDPSRRNIHRKENQFLYRNSSKLHAYDREKAPYPSSFDSQVVELQSLDNAVLLESKGRSSYVDFEGKPNPTRCLDIGTGLGLWVISTAKLWPEATFVGLDMVNMQIPLQVLEQEIAERIEWVHSNILRNKLPFEDEEFDHVHINGIALGVPENKWYPLYEEIRRVMKPGATIEHIEEDAIFPSLPRWYTDPLRARSRSLSTTGSVPARISYNGSSTTSNHRHEHELLEMLYEDVWSTRFINAHPTSILPGYFGAFFSRVLSPPVVQYQSPPFAPFAPLMPIRDTTIPPLPRAISHPSNGAESSIPLRNGSPPSSPRTETFSNGGSLRTSPSSTLRLSPEEVAKCDSSPSSSVTSLPHIDAPEVPPSPPRDPEAVSMLSTTSQAGSYSSGSTSSKSAKRPSVMLEGTSLGGEQVIDIFPVEKVQSQDEQTKYMHLYRTVTWVLSTKEAMWDELLVHVQAKDEILKKFGWTEEDYNEQASRARFECAIDQYQSDMRGRIALWNCALHNGWELPFPDPLTRAEVDEGIQLRREILEAQRLADNGDIEPPVRKIRILIGSKGS
uniref:N/A n=1 Tax=Ganoderma boninense TaxID=34458 RepID=A0A5K1JS95_9APHY|nr:N/A [Ganoderma boninense]